MIIAQEADRVIVQLPSKVFKFFDPRCVATTGIAAGGGRGDKPFVNASRAWFKHKARNKLYPRSSAVKMNAVDHPFGGHTKPGTPKSLGRWSSPGQKVGAVAPRRMGIRKK
jgi:large subunit ribosomal protein L2